MSPPRRRRLTLLINPTSGRGRALRRLPTVVSALSARAPEAEVLVRLSTDYANARAVAAQTVAEAADTDALLVMGGDGMVSIGLNAVAGTTVPLGVLPSGTGNDFCRGVGLPTKLDAAIDVVASGHIDAIDLMDLAGELVDGSQQRWVGSILSTGFDERVNWRTNRLPYTVGALSYATAAIAELARFVPLRYRIEIDGAPRELDAILIAVGNAGVFGGGIRGCPNADVRDGLLDLTIVHPVPRWKLLRLLPQLFDGSFVRDPAVELLRAREVLVDGDGLFGMADGEDLGRTPFICRAEPGAARLFVPA